MTATATAPRFYAVRIDGRNRVIDRATDSRVGTYASRAKAEAAATKLNDAAEKEQKAANTAQAAEDAVTAVYANFTASREARMVSGEETATEAAARRDAEQTELADAAAATAITAAMDAAENTETARIDAAKAVLAELPAPKVERIPLGHLPERKAPAKAAKAPAVKEPAPAPTSQIGKGVVRFTLTTEEAGTVAYTSGSQINRDYAKAVAEGRPAVLRTIKGHIIRQNQPTA
jgi:hypothetical protein